MFLRPKVAKHRYLQCAVPYTVFLKLQKHCKYEHFLRSTGQKCCNLQCFFCMAFKITGICSVLCLSGLKNIGIYSIFCFFFIAPAKDVKTFRKLENRPKNVSKRHFFPILGTLQTGGGPFALGDAYEPPGFRPKSSHPPSWRIFGVFRGPASEGRRLGAPLTIEL